MDWRFVWQKSKLIWLQINMPKALLFLDFDHRLLERPLGIIRRRDTPPQVVENHFLKLLLK